MRTGTQIIFARHDRRALRRRMRIETLVDRFLHPAVLAHLHDIEPVRIRPENIQCFDSSLAMTRSTELRAPNGLPQEMQGKGSSSLRTIVPAFQASKSTRGSIRMTFSGQVGLTEPALYAQALGEPQHRLVRIIGQGP